MIAVILFGGPDGNAEESARNCKERTLVIVFLLVQALIQLISNNFIRKTTRVIFGVFCLRKQHL